MKRRKNGFTLIELIAVLVILAIIALIVTPLVMNIVKKAKDSANKRSIDAYGKAVELGVATYLLDNGDYPTTLDDLTVEYTGNEVVCNIKTLNEDGSIYLSECSVKGIEVKDSSTDDGYYHYGKLIEKSEVAVAKILKKANNEVGLDYVPNNNNSQQLYKFEHEETVQTSALTDYRYIGSDPYNYVIFNDELWRIIGVFYVENEEGNQEQRIKIIRNEILGEYAWDSNGATEWSTASLQTYLNSEYYNSLREAAKGMIGETKYYLGGNDTTGHSASSYYKFERGNSVCNSSRSINWTEKIGIMYPSDYIYTYANGVDDTCYQNGYNCKESEASYPANSWLFKGKTEWFISPNSRIQYGKQGAFYIDATGSVNTYEFYSAKGRIDNYYNIRPVLYLKADVKITRGIGTQKNPYLLSL